MSGLDWLLLAFATIAFGFTTALFLLFQIKRRLRIWMAKELFQPDAVILQTPLEYGISFEEFFIDSFSETGQIQRLHAWYVPSPKSQCVVLFFHGNQGNISDRRETIKIYQKLGLSAFYVDYQGYGKSEGRCSQKAMENDAIASFDFLQRKLNQPPDQIIVHGRSLGGYPAAFVLSQRKPAGVIIESSFTSLTELARWRSSFSFLWKTKDEFPLVQWIQAKGEVPILVLHSASDERIPFYMSQRLYRESGFPCQLKRLQGSHDSGFLESRPSYDQWISNFVSECLNV